MQQDVETIFENFRGMYESCVEYSELWPEDIVTTAAFLSMLARKTSDMVEDFDTIMVNYVKSANESKSQGKLFDE